MDGCSDGYMMDGQINNIKKSTSRKYMQTSVFFTKLLKDLFEHLMKTVRTEHYDIVVLTDR